MSEPRIVPPGGLLASEREGAVMTDLTVDTFRAKVLVILTEAQSLPLPTGHAARRITDLYRSAVAAAEERRDAVLALHKPWTYVFLDGRKMTGCNTCTEDGGHWEDYPCPTARALGVTE